LIYLKGGGPARKEGVGAVENEVTKIERIPRGLRGHLNGLRSKTPCQGMWGNQRGKAPILAGVGTRGGVNTGYL